MSMTRLARDMDTTASAGHVKTEHAQGKVLFGFLTQVPVQTPKVIGLFSKPQSRGIT